MAHRRIKLIGQIQDIEEPSTGKYIDIVRDHYM